MGENLIFNSDKPILTVVLPIHDSPGRWENLENIVKARPKSVCFSIVHDAKSAIEIRSRPTYLAAEDVFVSGTFGGPGPSRNMGKRSVKTKWLMFCDSDDSPNLPEAISCIHELRDKSPKILIGSFILVEVVDGIPKLSEFDVERAPSSFALFPGLWRCIFLSDFVKDIDFPNVMCGEDLVFIFRTLREMKDNPTLCGRFIYTYIRSLDGSTSSHLNADSEAVSAGLILAREGGITESNISISYDFTLLRILADGFFVRPRDSLFIVGFVCKRILRRSRMVKQLLDVVVYRLKI